MTSVAATSTADPGKLPPADDFKPPSDENSEVYLARGQQGETMVAVPSSPDDTEKVAIYKGSEKPAGERDCLLIFDHKTGEFTIEQVATHIQVKKTRGTDGKEHLAHITSEIARIRKFSSKPLSKGEPIEVREMESSGSSSSSSEDSSSDEEQPKRRRTDSKTESAFKRPQSGEISHLQSSTSQLHDDLQLSESSDDEE